RVELLPGTAKVGVVLVAECEYGEVKLLQPGRRVGVELRPKAHRVVGRAAVTPSAGDDHEPRFLRQFGREAGVQFHDTRREISFLSFFGQTFGELLCGAGLAAIENEQRLSRRRL